MKILKFGFLGRGRELVSFPDGAQPLWIEQRGDILELYCLCDPTRHSVKKVVVGYAEGELIEAPAGLYIGTVHRSGPDAVPVHFFIEV